MTTDRQPSAAAKAWVQKEWGSPSHEEDLLEAFDAGAAAEHERVCIATPYQCNVARNDYAPAIYVTNYKLACGDDIPDFLLKSFCANCGGKIVCKEER